MTGRELVALLFSDIQGSTRLLESLGDEAYASVLAGYREILEEAITAVGGATIDTQGDGHFASFPTAAAAMAAAAAVQRGLAARPWEHEGGVQARIGVHAGEALVSDAGLVGMDVHRAARVASAGHGGQVLVTEHAHRAAAADLPPGAFWRDLGLHRFKDLTEPHRVYQLDVEGLPTSFPPIRSLSERPNNLPVQVTGLVGRGDDLAAVLDRLERHRLVTITGPGGAGKTRLALQAGAESIDRYELGVWLVELAPFTDPEVVPPEIAAELGVTQRPDTSLLDDIAAHLEAGTALLIVDNCEHLLEATARVVGELLRSCGTLKVLATSRHALGLPGEAQWPVRPLQTTQEGRSLGPAMELFAARARLVRPEFLVDDSNRSKVAAICERIDGLPLAIELAAARLRILDLDQLETRLEDRFRVLTGGGRSQAPHHQTMQATMEWSYELLGEEEKIALRRLAVFAGGFSLEATEAVVGSDPLDPLDVVDLVQELVDASLLAMDGGRFGMLGIVRDYARTLLAPDEEAALRLRHAEYFREFVRGGGGGLASKEQAEWLARLDDDYENIRSALAWAMVRADYDLAVGLAGGMARYWIRRGYYDEARRWLNPVAALDRLPPSPELSDVLRFSTALAIDAGETERAWELSLREAEVAAAVGDPVVQARSLNIRAGLAWRRGDLRLAADQLRAALVLLRPERHPFVQWLLVNLSEVLLSSGGLDEAAELVAELEASEGGDAPEVLRVRGLIALQRGDPRTAVELLEQAVAIYRERQLHNIEVVAIREQIDAALAAGDASRAAELLDRAMELYEGITDRINAVDTIRQRACLALLMGDLDAAERDLDAALADFVEAERAVNVAQVLEAQAELADRNGDLARAGLIDAAAQELSERTGYVAHAIQQRRMAELRERLAAAFGEGTLAAEREGVAGRSLAELAGLLQAKGGDAG